MPSKNQNITNNKKIQLSRSCKKTVDFETKITKKHKKNNMPHNLKNNNQNIITIDPNLCSCLLCRNNISIIKKTTIEVPIVKKPILEVPIVKKPIFEMPIVKNPNINTELNEYKSKCPGAPKKEVIIPRSYLMTFNPKKLIAINNYYKIKSQIFQI